MTLIKKNWILGVILIICFFTYQDSLNNDFTNLDDQVQVVQNPNIKSLSLENVKDIFSSTSVGMYQPLSTIAYSLTYQLEELNSRGYHFLSIIIHLINCLLVYRLLAHLDLSFSKCILLTSIFALHPMQVESIAWVSAFSNLLFTLFYLLSLIMYLKYKIKNEIRLYWFSLLFFLFAVFSKSAAITLPLVLLAFDYYLQARFSRKDWLTKVPFFAISIIFGLITIYSRESAGHLSDLSISFGLIDRIFLVAYSVLFYPFKFLFPLELSAFYPYPELQNGWLPWQYYATFPLLLVIAYIIYRFREKRLLVLGALFYLLSISIMLQLIPVGNQLTTDRYIYLPMIGLLMMTAAIIKIRHSKRIWFATIILGFILAVKSYSRSQVWANDQLIWEDVLEKHPKVAQAHNNLGSYLLKMGEQQKAFQHFDQAVTLKPYYADAYSNRGNLYSLLGKSEEAMADFNQAIQLRPHADAYFNRANERVKNKELQAAINDYTESINLRPSADAFTNRAYTYLQLGKVAPALNDLQAAIRQDPNFAQAYFLKGMIAEKQNDLSSACQFFRKAANLGDQKATQAIARFCSQ